ncbi:MAG: ABC transporter permease [Defluviitaleaceae bacterium]|nr:ABC transporter permease [Defluviitaleaceae bacterium]MCL2273318.1 ABC transporter permease [Defluviitaleaceae bacterium]
MKRDSIMSFLSSLVVLVIGLFVGFLILLFSNPGAAAGAFSTILTFGFSSMRNIGDVLHGATPIIMTGLSVAFAFKTGLFNIGATGQFAFGGLVAILIGLNFQGMPDGLRILFALVAATAAGAAWGAIPGLLKAYRNVHEVISCIMTNYIGMFLVGYFVEQHAFFAIENRSASLPTNSNLPTLGLDRVFQSEILPGLIRSSDINAGFFIAIFMAIVIYLILNKTTFGYELKACGFNRDAAKYAGINENRNIVAAMMISGALAGLGGALLYLSGTVHIAAGNNLLPYGFTGISVAFLGLSNPIGIIFSGALVSHLFLGGARIQLNFPIEIVEIVISIIIYFCAFVFLVKTFLGKHIGKLFKGGEKS